MLWAISVFDVPLRRVLFRVLDDEKRDLATSWLSGNQTLTDDDYQKLGVSGPLGDEDVPDLMKHLGQLSSGAGPIVLILDQLDDLVHREQILEIESLMIDLVDSSQNWYILVSVVNEKFDLWFSTVSQPFKGIFGTQKDDAWTLKVAELPLLEPAQKRLLISARLASPALNAQRAKDAQADRFYPLSEREVDELSNSSISNPRILIKKGSDVSWKR